MGSTYEAAQSVVTMHANARSPGDDAAGRRAALLRSTMWRLDARTPSAQTLVRSRFLTTLTSPRHVKAGGRITLPITVDWSGERPLVYDLNDQRDRQRVYELVLREGSDDDVRRYIDVDVLLEEWHALVLPARVRRAWAAWFRRRRGVDLG